MSDRSDHLIERAAAKLRDANATFVPDGPGTPPPPATHFGNRPPADGKIANGAVDPVRPVLPVPSFQPFTPPPPNRPNAPSVPGGPAGDKPGFSMDDAVTEGAAGPIPPPAPPLTRPVLAQLPPPIVLSPGPPASPPAMGGAILSAQAKQRPRNGPGSAMALQAPPIVQLDALERAGMVVARTTRTRISEEYRIAIGRILRSLHESTDVQGARNVLMVTSARPGEGKSFTALNLAGSIAQNGTDAVLLVDVDPKVKPLSDQLGLGDSQGFLDLVSDPSLRPEDMLRVTAIPNLAIMPVGTRLGGAAQTTGGTASMRPIIPTITRLARRFPKHLIMLDAPPCLSTSDPHMLAPHVGQVVLVVEAERTQRSEVEAAIDLVRVCPNITMLLNKVRMTTSHTFGAYDYFGSYT